MTYNEMYAKLRDFVFPINVAFVSIEFDSRKDGEVFEDLCRQFGYRVLHYINRDSFEVRFWRGFISEKWVSEVFKHPTNDNQ